MKALPKRWIEYLRCKPESGMGYQNVDIYLSDERVIRGVPVFNGSVIGDLLEEWREIDPEQIVRVEFADERPDST